MPLIEMLTNHCCDDFYYGKSFSPYSLEQCMVMFAKTHATHTDSLTNCLDFTETALGQGADLALSACMTGFDSIGGCTVNGSSFINSHTARKGGSVQLSNGRLGVSYVEFYGCYFMNVSTGANIEDDPQGEGGVFSVGTGNTLVLVDSVVVDGYAGKKVRSKSFDL